MPVLTGIRLLAAVKAAVDSPDRVDKFVKIVGFVNAAPDCKEHPAMIQGCSDLLVEVFGGRGRHARSAVGVSGRPAGIVVGIEAVLQVR